MGDPDRADAADHPHLHRLSRRGRADEADPVSPLHVRRLVAVLPVARLDRHEAGRRLEQQSAAEGILSPSRSGDRTDAGDGGRVLYLAPRARIAARASGLAPQRRDNARQRIALNQQFFPSVHFERSRETCAALMTRFSTVLETNGLGLMLDALINKASDPAWPPRRAPGRPAWPCAPRGRSSRSARPARPPSSCRCC